jgi:hypothetical protein
MACFSAGRRIVSASKKPWGSPFAKNTFFVGAQCLHFDGVDDYVSISDGANLDLDGAFTLELFAYPESSTSTTVLSKWWDGSVRGFNLSLSENSVRFDFRPTDLSYDLILEIEGSFGGAWNAISVRYDGAFMTLMINEEKVTQACESGVRANNASLTIGKYIHTSLVNYFAGYIDSVRLWKAYRSDETVFNDLRTIVLSNASMYLYFPIDEGEGASLANMASELYTGTINGCSWEKNKLV